MIEERRPTKGYTVTTMVSGPSFAIRPDPGAGFVGPDARPSRSASQREIAACPDVSGTTISEARRLFARAILLTCWSSLAVASDQPSVTWLPLQVYGPETVGVADRWRL